MQFLQKSRQIFTALALALILTITTACSGGSLTAQKPQLPPNSSSSYNQIERGSTASGQQFGNWVVRESKGLVKDAYVRDNNKLGVVITPQVKPNEVRPLARSLVQGFHKNFPNQDLTVLVYAPDKKLILTTKYDQQSEQIRYES
ncbi:hypothetical protein NIES2119_30785 [[Phormidium ambiguum] IAM M-71]|uniref:Lipoprotein n=1 Tax=[Phormidium ambiguum] IAM M-71 TaxID=454136 RepID=A0A1U7I328_9CYAN|nr:hypothetical protein [Phormidium ambiguum]OKH30549.1 hypothetical protein NIES2119_30785 [Phormidium ambiguum IAM M-71]